MSIFVSAFLLTFVTDYIVLLTRNMIGKPYIAGGKSLSQVIEGVISSYIITLIALYSIKLLIQYKFWSIFL